ncbi:MAG: antibiotic biosynthesis monooxygenase [Clostridiaceae bacterium]|jgi:quinol monooxygenase YgiN|nr:antibiotic biosynthesis monooxygenase [Clostridiaceae bacterium]
MIKVVAKHFVKENKIDEILKLYKILVEKSRNDEGCISYELFQDVNDQSILTIIEQWENRKALDNHLSDSDFKLLILKTSDMLEKETEINLYKQII